MNPNQTLHLWSALKLHFSTPQYDFVKYHGKLKNPARFEKRKDKHFFSWLSRKPDPKGLMISNLIKNPNIFVGDLFNPEATDIYFDWKKRQESLTYVFTEDIKKLVFPAHFKVINGQHPTLLKKYLQGDICIETVAILDDILGIITIWDRKLKNDSVWQSIRLPLIKYKPFLEYNKDSFRKILLDNFLYVMVE